MNEEQKDKLGMLIDTLDSTAHGLDIPLPASFHLEQMKLIIPEKVKELKDIYIEITGENPWQ